MSKRKKRAAIIYAIQDQVSLLLCCTCPNQPIDEDVYGAIERIETLAELLLEVDEETND